MVDRIAASAVDANGPFGGLGHVRRGPDRCTRKVVLIGANVAPGNGRAT
jgi:hypothetical protein